MSSETVKTNKRKSIPEKLPGDDAVTYNGEFFESVDGFQAILCSHCDGD
jgi:hypothetical protein